MTLPTIHLNGTNATSLVYYYSEAALSVSDAIKAIENASPNGRDYYTQGNAALTSAMQEHKSRIDALVSIRDEMNKLAEHCAQFVR